MNRLDLISAHLAPQHTAVVERDWVSCEIRESEKIAILTLTDTKALNAISAERVRAVNEKLIELESNPKVSVIIITGTGRAFSAGANIAGLNAIPFPQIMINDFFERDWFAVMPTYKKVVIAAINGFCFGGGFELALMCDILVASDEAKFGFPEIKLGLFPGAGGTQKLIREVGKSRAMEYILTGDMFSAKEALDLRVVSRIYPKDKLLEETLKLAKKIASHSNIATTAAKRAVNIAYEVPLSQGLLWERSLFNSLLPTNDAREGTLAFMEKRKPKFTDS